MRHGPTHAHAHVHVSALANTCVAPARARALACVLWACVFVGAQTLRAARNLHSSPILRSYTPTIEPGWGSGVGRAGRQRGPRPLHGTQTGARRSRERARQRTKPADRAALSRKGSVEVVAPRTRLDAAVGDRVAECEQPERICRGRGHGVPESPAERPATGFQTTAPYTRLALQVYTAGNKG